MTFFSANDTAPCASPAAAQRLPAGLKLLAALACVLFMAVLPRQWPHGLAAIAAVLLAIALTVRLHWRWLLLRLLLVEPLLLAAAALSYWQHRQLQEPLWLLTRSSLCLLTLLLLAATTPMNQLLATLRRAGVPPLLVTTLALMQRYLQVLLEESQRLRRARASRRLAPPGGLGSGLFQGLIRRWGQLAGVAGQLFLRALARSERIYAAMSARGWR